MSVHNRESDDADVLTVRTAPLEDEPPHTPDLTRRTIDNAEGDIVVYATHPMAADEDEDVGDQWMSVDPAGEYATEAWR